MVISIDELAEEVVSTASYYFETSMKSNRPFHNNWEAMWFHLLRIYKTGEKTDANGRVINPQRKIAEAIARRIMRENDLLYMDILSRNLGKSSDKVSEEDRQFLNYLGPRLVIPLENYVDATEKARSDIISMMKRVKSATYQERLAA